MTTMHIEVKMVSWITSMQIEVRAGTLDPCYEVSTGAKDDSNSDRGQ